MANKQKTRVVLPGGIQGLVHTLQNGTAEPNLNPQVDVTKITTSSDDNADENVAEPVVAAEPQPALAQQPAASEPQSAPQQPAQAQPANTVSEVGENEAATAATAPQSASAERAPRGRRPKENTMKEYTIVKDDSRDSWDLFLDMAKQYKDGGGKLATIYIDESLKNVLDRMKYCGPEKLSTSAILSSIVARFIFDHEDDIKKVMFSGRLI